jgi:hypothetical protein
MGRFLFFVTVFVYLKIAVSVYVGGVDGNVQITVVRSSLTVILPPGIRRHSAMKVTTAFGLKGIVAVHVPSVGVAGWPPILSGLHVAMASECL